jgi:methylmalonyl-CoA mutase C-terminal domain/subunit
MTVFPKIIEIMKQKALTNVLLTGGGIIPDADVEKLKAFGVGELFAPGTAMQTIVSYISSWAAENRNF